MSVSNSRIIDDEIILVRYYPNYKTALGWYQDLQLCKQVDNRDSVYDLSLLTDYAVMCVCSRMVR